MSTFTATAVACANIAFIKYWGNRDQTLRLPANPSLSMNLDGLTARTTVEFDERFPADTFILNGASTTSKGEKRVHLFLEEIRRLAKCSLFARVESINTFPTGVGIASSAAAFAALALAGSAALGLKLTEAELSRLARRGSGSACRSVPGGFVEWQMGAGDLDSYAFSIAPADHWNLHDCIAVISAQHKTTGSTEGHALANTSPLQAARVQDADRRMERCRSAILQRDFAALASIVEQDSTIMHAVMMTSQPPLYYWQSATLGVMLAVQEWRRSGLPVCFTIDAGPNVHVLCESAVQPAVISRLQELPGVQRVITAGPGPAAHLISAK
jgi:diphosphomevalonate decarboxylase